MAEKVKLYVKNVPEHLARFFVTLGRKAESGKRKAEISQAAVNKFMRTRLPELRSHAAFPKPGKQGFLVTELTAFFQESGNGELPAAAPELPGMTDPEQFKKLLDRLQDKLFNPDKYIDDKILVWEVKLLKDNRPELFESPAANPAPRRSPGMAEDAAPQIDNDLCDTYSELATRMALHYCNPDGSSKLKHDLDKNAVSDWKQGKRLDGRPGPPARVGAKRQMSLRAWLKWFDTNFFADWKLDDAGELRGMQGVQNLTEMKRADEIEELEFRKWERQKELGKYISVESAARLAGGESRQLADYWRNRNEGTMLVAFKERLVLVAARLDEKLGQLGVAPEARQEFGKAVVVENQLLADWLAGEHRRFTDEAEARAATAAEKYAAELKAEVDRLMEH